MLQKFKQENNLLLFDLISAQRVRGIMTSGGGEYVKSILFLLLNRGFTGFEAVMLESRELDNEIIARLEMEGIRVHRCQNLRQVQELLDSGKFNRYFCGLNTNHLDSLSFPKYVELVLTEHGLRRVETKIDQMYLRTEKINPKLLVRFLISSTFPNLYRDIAIKTRGRQFECSNNIQVITVSYHSKCAIEICYPQLKGKITVAYSPMKQTARSNCSIWPDYLSRDSNYALMVSASRGEKNCLRACMAFDDLITKKLLPKDFKIVLTGVTYSRPFKRAIKNKSNYILLPYVSSSELELLYKNAYFFFYPTVNEGFGYPPLEAARWNVPSAVSAVCSLPEVCGDAVLYFNPYDVLEMENRILQLFDDEIRNDLIDKAGNNLSRIAQMQNDGFERVASLLELR